MSSPNPVLISNLLSDALFLTSLNVRKEKTYSQESVILKSRGNSQPCWEPPGYFKVNFMFQIHLSEALCRCSNHSMKETKVGV